MDRWNRVNRAVPGLILLSCSAAEAHKGWFLDTTPYPLRWSLFLQPLPLGITLLAILTVAGLAWVQQRRSGVGFLPDPERFGAAPGRLAGLYALMPLLLGIHVAIPLAINAMQRHLFVPDVPLPLSLLDLVELGIALALFFGILTRYAAVALALLWVLGVFLVGLRPMLENIHFLGYASFFFFAGRGPISVDRILFPHLEPNARRLRLAIPALRVGIALSIIAVAFTEKLADLPYALAFLQKYPLNFVHQVGIPLPDTLFLVGAGGVELGIGLMLLCNLFTREISILGWVFFNLTLSVFDVTELINHLPFYAAMFLLILWKPSEHSQELWQLGLQDALLPLERVTPAGIPGRA
ncbi:DoxX protein (plasmid) [Deinococcus radiomollis]|uniref:DoxX protein n=1 Tax=Deinococcus radiomollis TaxID=468916 RepID=UPI0038912D60